MSTTTRKQAPRLARPAARYWKGKAPKGVNVATLDVDSDEEEEYDPEAQADPGDVSLSGELALGGEDEEDDDDDDHLARAAPALKKGINVALKDVNISRDGKVIVAGREESGRTLEEVGAYDLKYIRPCSHGR
jgi:microfibrillar-associated protein 1